MSMHAATSALQHAGDFTNSAEGTPKGAPSRFAPKPSGQHADAPYKMASSGADKEIGDVASGIKWRQEQSKAAHDATNTQ